MSGSVSRLPFPHGTRKAVQTESLRLLPPQTSGAQDTRVVMTRSMRGQREI